MPVRPTYPGVYIEEVPSGVRTIVGVATSITAFIGFFKRGPMNRAVQIFNMGDFERVFGGLDIHSEASYAIQQFFLNGGTEAWVIRTASDDSSTSPPTPTPPTAASVTLQDRHGSNVLQVTAGQRLRGRSVDNPGIWGNKLFIDVDYATDDPNNQFNLVVSEIDIRNNRRVVLQSESFRNLTMTAGANNVFDVVNEGSKLIQLSSQDGWPQERPAQTGTVGNALTSVPGIADGERFTINYPDGSRDATLQISTAPSNLRDVRTIVEAAIRKAGSDTTLGPPEPLLSGATVQLIGDQLRILAGGRTNADFNVDTLLTFSDDSATTTTTALGLAGVSGNVQQYKAERGSDGDRPEANELIGIRDPDKTGLYALEDVDIFNILCIPRAAKLEDDSDMQAVLSAAISYCVEQQAFLLVDIPARIDTVQKAKDWLEDNATLRSPNAAVYFPRPRIADPLNGYRLKSVGASGTIAGLYARTDAERGVWKAPAGIEATLRNVQELDYTLTDPENGTLNPLGINCLRTFPVYGNVSWGARTLFGADQMASEWKYIPIRRLALFIEESLYRGTKWVVFEPNDEPLWAKIRLNVGAFMMSLFRQGAFQGTTPNKAFYVKCDSETTIQDDRNQGIVNIEVGFAPLKPAEFVIIRIQQMAGDLV